MDIKQSTEGDSGFAIGKLRTETGRVTFDPGYAATGHILVGYVATDYGKDAHQPRSCRSPVLPPRD